MQDHQNIAFCLCAKEAILLCAMDVAAGMGYLHSMGVIHADLKPANVLLMSAPVTAEDPRGFTCKVGSQEDVSSIAWSMKMWCLVRRIVSALEG